MAHVNVPEARLITVKPWDKSVMKAVEKAIREADLGLNPQTDGDIIRVPLPPLTEERRKEFVKVARKYGEECKVTIRKARHASRSTCSTRAKRDGGAFGGRSGLLGEEEDRGDRRGGEQARGGALVGRGKEKDILEGVRTAVAGAGASAGGAREAARAPVREQQRGAGAGGSAGAGAEAARAEAEEPSKAACSSAPRKFVALDAETCSLDRANWSSWPPHLDTPSTDEILFQISGRSESVSHAAQPAVGPERRRPPTRAQ